MHPLLNLSLCGVVGVLDTEEGTHQVPSVLLSAPLSPHAIIVPEELVVHPRRLIAGVLDNSRRGCDSVPCLDGCDSFAGHLSLDPEP
jgi:hypothetical protein